MLDKGFNGKRQFQRRISLLRIVGNTEDLQHIYNHENKNKEFSNGNEHETLNIATEAMIVTPTRDSRTKKLRHDTFQFEEEKSSY